MSKAVLLVEDNLDDVTLALRALKKCGFGEAVDVVRDGAEALKYLFGGGSGDAGAPGALPRVVLLDLKLPRVDGPEVLRRLRAEERTGRLPVVVLTSGEPRGVEEEPGLSVFLRKPVTREGLAEVARSLGLDLRPPEDAEKEGV